jgi:phosphatidylserine/phosphatidylglycerophosphate/cardiolipin synthase-like enzyme
MSSVSATAGSLTVKAYVGDFKTLLAFNLDKRSSAGLAGFTILCKAGTDPAYYLLNNLQFETPGDHAQDATEPPNASINAPIHKFRWLHVPGSFHQGVDPATGPYTYTVTPRYFDDQQSMKPIDPSLAASVTVNVGPFEKGDLALGFTRGFTQSQAFVHHFGLKALIRPKERTFVFDTSQESGTNAAGQQYTYEDEYKWLGFTARTKIFELLDEVQKDQSLQLDVFAYDLNEPDIIGIFLALAKERRIRIILDNAALHHSASSPKAEDDFEQAFRKAGGGKNADILRGKFGRYSHDKVFIVSKDGTALKVLTGSTNFSVTGLYVNSNHVLVFSDDEVPAQYLTLFEAVWADNAKKKAFIASDLSAQPFSFGSKTIPQTDITFAPHAPDVTDSILGGLVDRIKKESRAKKGQGSVLFAVMAIDQGTSPVYTELKGIHADQTIFSYGISDNPGGIFLFKPGKKTGVLVTGKPIGTILPPPFNQVPNIGGVGHQVHHKFVVCGFNGGDPVVYCGSSNLASGGEENNGDNLLEIHDEDVATVFAIEALGLVDHFNFLDRYSKGKGAPKRPVANKRQAALDAHWYLETNEKWAGPYFDRNDLHFVDRELFG